MNKYRTVIGIIAAMIVVELILLVTQPIVVDLANTANATMAASSNMSNYPGTSDFMVASPWILYFVPPAIGMFLIFLTLRQKQQ